MWVLLGWRRQCAVILAGGTFATVSACQNGTSPSAPTARDTDGTSDSGSSGAGGDASSSTSPSGGSSSSGASGDAGDAPPAPAVPYVDFAINHILITGQSNSVALEGKPVLSTTQPFGNLMFNTGVMPMTECDGAGCKTYDTPSSFVPLVEGDTFFSPVETASSGFANEISHLVTTKYGALASVKDLPAKHDLLVSLHGRSGNTYQCLRKGGCNYKPGYLAPFDQAMKEVTNAKAIATALGKSYVVRAVATIHGESDHYSYTAGSQEFPMPGTDGTPGKIQTYADGLIEWQEDYETEVRKITGQTIPIPLFVSQISGWNDAPTSKVAQYELEAHVRAPGKVILIGASYDLALSQADCKHFTSDGERRLGEYFAKVYTRVIVEGKAWEPVRPKTITRSGAVVTVVFHVPVAPLVIDTQRVPAIESFGFTYAADAGASPAIANVELTGPDSARITLAAAPSGPGHLRYAQNQTPNSCIGAPNGARGNLRDSDPTPSKSGYELHNWAVSFDMPVP